MTTFAEKVAAHRSPLRARGGNPLSWEMRRPQGGCRYWFNIACYHVAQRGMNVARQLARLSGGDMDVNLSWRSLAGAVQQRGREQGEISYVRGGTEDLVKAGFVEVIKEGAGRGAVTTFRLLLPSCMPGCDHGGFRSRFAPKDDAEYR